MSPLDLVLGKLPDAKKTGAGWQARCPAHDDGTASLSLGLGTKGGAVIKCHAGCLPDAVVGALGLRLADLMPTASTQARPTIAKTYPYRDESGALLWEVVRYDPKGFRQRRPDGHGGYLWNLSGVRRILYRLDKLHAERPKGVFVCEGEKDADAVVRLGLQATCSAAGAGKWHDEHAAQLVSCGVQMVCVLPDNDDPGRLHSEQVAASCRARGLKVRIVELPGLSKKGDVSDWIAAGGTNDALVALAKASSDWQPGHLVTPPSPATPPAVTMGESAPDAKGAPVIVRLSDVAAEPVEWIWPQRLARGKKTIFAADPGVGKSTVSIDIAARISRGAPWPDGGRAPLGNVLFLCAEDGLADTVRPRIDAANGDPTRVYVLDGMHDGANGTRTVTLADLATLEAAIASVQPVLIVVDPITAYLGKTDSYKDAEVRGLLAPLLSILPKYGAALLTVAHFSKDQQKTALHRASGSIAFVAAARLGFAIGADPSVPDRRVLVPIKANICAPAASLAFRIVDATVPATGAQSQSHVEWFGPVEMDAEALFRRAPSEEHPGDHADADVFLTELLEDGAVRAETVFSQARSAGVSERQVKNAKARLGIKAMRTGGVGSAGHWVWRLPVALDSEDSAKGITKGPATQGDPLSPLSANAPEMGPHAPKGINFVAPDPLGESEAQSEGF